MKVILDVDTGIDDALAIAHALGLPELELIGISTGFGNVLAAQATKNTLNILELLGAADDVPVYQGALCPWGESDYTVKPFLHRIHGKNGLANIELGEPVHQKQEMSAVDFLIESAKQYGKDLTLITVAALTNLAEALQKDEKSIRKIGQIVTMGGAVTVNGNASPFAEGNVIRDPRAAKYVFESGLPITLVGLDVTMKTMFTGKHIEAWKDSGSRAHQVFKELTWYYYKNEYGMKDFGGAMHDALAVEAAAHPEVIKLRHPMHLTVETEGISAGRTIGDRKKLLLPDKNIQVCLDVDNEAFMKSFMVSLNKI